MHGRGPLKSFKEFGVLHNLSVKTFYRLKYYSEV